jgi:hypothetical protein
MADSLRIEEYVRTHPVISFVFVACLATTSFIVTSSLIAGPQSINIIPAVALGVLIGGAVLFIRRKTIN